MPRIAGQVDEAKTEAILDAASVLFAEKGLAASMDEIARRAGVSKQTLYNRYSTKGDIGRALAGRRADDITAPLRGEGDAEAILTALAATVIGKTCRPDKGMSLRGVALMSPDQPEIARAIYEAGPETGLKRLAAWLAEQDRLGVLSIPDTDHAAEMFIGMALGHGHLRAMLGVPHPRIERIEACAQEAARRFVRAFARD